jgi:aryl carrier-like protein
MEGDAISLMDVVLWWRRNGGVVRPACHCLIPWPDRGEARHWRESCHFSTSQNNLIDNGLRSLPMLGEWSILNATNLQRPNGMLGLGSDPRTCSFVSSRPST